MLMGNAEERRKKRRDVLVYGLGVAAATLITRGVWDLSAEVMSPLTSLLVGLAVVGGVAYVRRDFVEKLF